MKSWMIATVALVVLATSAHAGPCPAALDGALRLVLVTTPSMSTASAEMALFARATRSMPWERVGGIERAVVGKAGLGWGYTFAHLKRGAEPEKFEGDNRTPAGFFRIGPSFGFMNADLPGHILIKARETVCVESPASPLYNMIRKRAELGAGDRADDMTPHAPLPEGAFRPVSDRPRKSPRFLHSHPHLGVASEKGRPAVSQCRRLALLHCRSSRAPVR